MVLFVPFRLQQNAVTVICHRVWFSEGIQIPLSSVWPSKVTQALYGPHLVLEIGLPLVRADF